VNDEDVEQALEQLRQDEAILTPVERSAEMGDVVTLDVRGALVDAEGDGDDDEGKSKSLLIDRRAMQIRLDQDNLYPAPGFVEKVLGMAVGDEREFDITLPDNEDVDDELRGKTVHFEVTCSEVYLNELPELDDEFAQTIGDHNSLADLKAEIREQLERAAHREAREHYTDKILEKLVEDEAVRISYPPVMLDEQIDDMVTDLENRLERQGLTLDLYLKASDMTAEDLRESFSEDAKRMLTRGLILGKIVDLERLTVDDEEIDDEIQTRLLSFGAQASLARQVLSAPRMRKMIANELMIDKALERLALIARGEAPDLEALESETQAETSEEEQPEEDAEDASQQVESGSEGEETSAIDTTTARPSEEEALEVAVDDDEC
jgi:trigger factor